MGPGTFRATNRSLNLFVNSIEGIVNSKSLGYGSSDVRDIDLTLIKSLPQVIYPASDIIWLHYPCRSCLEALFVTLFARLAFEKQMCFWCCNDSWFTKCPCHLVRSIPFVRVATVAGGDNDITWPVTWLNRHIECADDDWWAQPLHCDFNILLPMTAMFWSHNQNWHWCFDDNLCAMPCLYVDTKCQTASNVFHFPWSHEAYSVCLCLMVNVYMMTVTCPVQYGRARKTDALSGFRTGADDHLPFVWLCS